MKAKLSLPERPSALFLVAVLDLLVVLLIFSTLIPVVAQQAGAVIDFAEMPSRTPNIRLAEKTTVTVTADTPPVIYLAGTRVGIEDLEAELRRKREDTGIHWVYILPDARVTIDQVNEIWFTVRAAGLKPLLGGTLPLESGGEPDP